MERLTKTCKFDNQEHVMLKNHRTWILRKEYDGNTDSENAIVRLAAYEDAEEDGRLIILPVKPGDFVYTLNYPHGGNFLMIFQHCVKDLQEVITWTLHGAFGKSVFLTREEAEAALAAMEGRV